MWNFSQFFSRLLRLAFSPRKLASIWALLSLNTEKRAGVLTVPISELGGEVSVQVEGSSSALIELASITAKLEESISTRDHADQSLWRQIGMIEAKLSDLSLRSAYAVSELERLAMLYGMLAVRPARGIEALPVPPPANVGAASDSESELHALRSQRDTLLNANDALRRELQNALRPSGVRKGPPTLSSSSPHYPAELLPAEALTIVDVGGQNLVNEDHIYSRLVKFGKAKVIAFEPLVEKARERAESDSNVVMLNNFVGSGELGRFHITRFDPASSLYEPDAGFLSQFSALKEMCEVVNVENVVTTRLDDVSGIEHCDFLKIDVQGGELDVLISGSRVLSTVACVHCEVEFSAVYIGQPLFADVDSYLRGAGFELIDLVGAGYGQYRAIDRPTCESRLLWAEAIYFRSSDLIEAGSTLLTCAAIAHINYGMYDLASHYLERYDALEGTGHKDLYQKALSAR